MGPFVYLYRAKEHHYGTNNGSVVDSLRVRLVYLYKEDMGDLGVWRYSVMDRNMTSP